MKHNYINTVKGIITIILVFFGLMLNAQNIQLTFSDPTVTNDGMNDFYEVDVMIQTIDGQADFKLGSGQLYFNYNTSAFGMNVVANGSFIISADYASGYFLGEMSGFTDFYNITTINDNSSDRASWSFSQGVSSGAMTEVVGTTPRKLVHLKIMYTDVNQDPMLSFETDEGVVNNCRDQFFTACGPFDSATTTLDCTADVDPQNVNVQFLDAEFDSSGATLGLDDFKQLTGISVYPNPTKGMLYMKGNLSDVISAEVYSMTGQRVLKVRDNFNAINLETLNSSIYFLKLITASATGTIKIIKE